MTSLRTNQSHSKSEQYLCLTISSTENLYKIIAYHALVPQKILTKSLLAHQSHRKSERHLFLPITGSFMCTQKSERQLCPMALLLTICVFKDADYIFEFRTRIKYINLVTEFRGACDDFCWCSVSYLVLFIFSISYRT